MNSISQAEFDILNRFRKGETLQGWEDFRLEDLASWGYLLRGEPIYMDEELRIECKDGVLVVDRLVLVDLNKRLKAKTAASQTYTISARGIRALENPTISKPSSIPTWRM